jgi:predicted nucleic acid-binding Zn finger protein
LRLLIRDLNRTRCLHCQSYYIRWKDGDQSVVDYGFCNTPLTLHHVAKIGSLCYKLRGEKSGQETQKFVIIKSAITVLELEGMVSLFFCTFRVYTSLEDLKGNTTEPVKFTTSACEPDPPTPPKLSNKNKTSIALKWSVSF